MILLLNTLVEGLAGLLFLFYPGASELVPGFDDGTGSSYVLLMKMYGVAALFLAALSGVGYLKRDNRELIQTISGLLALFHFGLAIVLTYYHPDTRAMLLHFLLGIFLGGEYVKSRRLLTR